MEAVTDAETAGQLARAGRRRARRLLDVRTTARQVATIYDSTPGQGRGSSRLHESSALMKPSLESLTRALRQLGEPNTSISATDVKGLPAPRTSCKDRNRT